MKHNKWALLNIVREAVDSGEISTGDLANIIRSRNGGVGQFHFWTNFLYYFGGVVLLLGIFFLVGDHWKSLGTLVRILIAVGIPVLAYWAAIFSARKEAYAVLTRPLFLIFAVLLPSAFGVSFYEGGALFQAFNASYLMGFSVLACAWAFYFYRRTEILVFLVLYASLYYLSLLKYWHYFENSTHAFEYHLIGMLILAVALAAYFYKTWEQNRPGLAKACSRIGMLLVFFCLMTLRSKDMVWHWFWEVLMLASLVINFRLARLRQDIFLYVLGFVFLILYVINFTGDYFQSSVAWTVILILLGVSLIWIAFRKGRR